MSLHVATVPFYGSLFRDWEYGAIRDKEMGANMNKNKIKSSDKFGEAGAREVVRPCKSTAATGGLAIDK